MAVTKSTYEKKILWLKPIKCELIAFVLWPNLDRAIGIRQVRAAKRWFGWHKFTDADFKKLEENKGVLLACDRLGKLRFALETKPVLEAEHSLPIYLTRGEVPKGVSTKGALQKVAQWSTKLKPVGILAGGGVDKWYFLYRAKEEETPLKPE